MNGTPCEPPSKWRDAHLILSIAQDARGLPFPEISSARASFNFTSVTHARDAREAVAEAEMILSYSLHVEFAPKDTPRIGSSAHYILEAWLPSGLAVNIVARAQHYAGLDAPQDAREDVPVPALVA